MKGLCGLLMLLGFLGSSADAQHEDSSVLLLQQLVGEWYLTGTKDDVSQTESWRSVHNELLVGSGVLTHEGDTVFTEQLKLEKRGQTWYYVAEVAENPAPVFFEIQEISGSGFIARNDAHDFPKVIQYKISQDHLTATISDGLKKNIVFEFARLVRY